MFSSSDLEREGQLIELGGYDFATQESSSSKIQKYRPVDAKEKLAKFIDDGGKFFVHMEEVFELSKDVLTNTNTELSTQIQPSFPTALKAGHNAPVFGGTLEVVVMYQIMKDSVKRLLWGGDWKKFDDVAKNSKGLHLKQDLTQFRVEQSMRKR